MAGESASSRMPIRCSRPSAKVNTSVVRWERRGERVLLRLVSYQNYAEDGEPIAQAVENQVVRLHGKDYDIAPLVKVAKQHVIERIHAETRRQLGLGVELDRILFVGGGTVALAEDIANWFPNQAIAKHPAFANARGMLKYLRYVCEVPSP